MAVWVGSGRGSNLCLDRRANKIKRVDKIAHGPISLAQMPGAEALVVALRAAPSAAKKLEILSSTSYQLLKPVEEINESGLVNLLFDLTDAPATERLTVSSPCTIIQPHLHFY